MQVFQYAALKQGLPLKSFKEGVTMAQRETLSLNTAKAIKSLRYNVGYTQKELAADVGVSISTVKTWETGRAMPAPKQYKKLQDTLSALEENEIIPYEVFVNLRDMIEVSREKDIAIATMLHVQPASN